MEVKIEENGGEAKENKVILLTIKNVVYPINTDIIYRVASRHGFVERIVIFKKKFQQVKITFFSTFENGSSFSATVFVPLEVEFQKSLTKKSCLIR